MLPMDKPKSRRLPDALRDAPEFGIPFLLVLYLAFASGGYDLVSRSQVGIIAWWAVLLGIAVGVLPAARVTRAGRIALAVVGALVLWTAAGALIWTDSTERSVIELSRVATLFGVFTLLVLIQGRNGLRHAINAIAAAVAIISVVALTDRFLPDLLPFGLDYNFPANYPAARLNYPLEYWNGLAAFVALGVGPLIWIAASGKTIVGRAAASGILPVIGLAGYLTASRGGVIEVLAVLIVMVILFPKRILLLLTLLAPAAGTILLVSLVNDRPEVRDLIQGDLASSQGTEMFWITVAVLIVVAGLQALAMFGMKKSDLKLPEPSHAAARNTGIAAAAIAVLVLVGVVASGSAGDRWSEFKQPQSGETVNRLGSFASGERYENWKSALDASSSERLTGIGPGTYEYWYAREGGGFTFVRDAHSIYLESLAEMGPVGLILVLALILGPLGMAVALALKRGSEWRRGMAAAAAAGMTAFAVAAGIDWAWEMTVLPVMFFVLAAGILGAESGNPILAVLPETSVRPVPTRSAPPGWRTRIPIAVGALVAIALIAVPLAATNAFRDSQAALRAGDVEQSLDDAQRAVSLQPYSASAKVQEAQVLAVLGRNVEAADIAREAIEEEPVNWRNWLVLSQLLVKSSGKESRIAYERARKLNPRSSIFSSQ